MNADPTLRDTTDLDDGFAVLDECHRRMLARVGELERLVATPDANDLGAAERANIAAIADFLSRTVHHHHRDEERHVFPSLVGGGDAQVVQAVLRLRQDHGWLEEDWRELEPHVRSLASGYGGCNLELLRDGVVIYAALLRDHIALEEALVYPEARSRLGAVGRHALGRSLAARKRGRATAR